MRGLGFLLVWGFFTIRDWNSNSTFNISGTFKPAK